jgi:hypothetical protein
MTRRLCIMYVKYMLTNSQWCIKLAMHMLIITSGRWMPDWVEITGTTILC